MVSFRCYALVRKEVHFFRQGNEFKGGVEPENDRKAPDDEYEATGKSLPIKKAVKSQTARPVGPVDLNSPEAKTIREECKKKILAFDFIKLVKPQELDSYWRADLDVRHSSL
ncbi:hypothetical protein M1146_05415 [Patescibacteria group bacterium]|nr:hypothetical protein [Patescibacteria group bacterium]